MSEVRYREHYNELANVPIEEVAKIAAILVRNGDAAGEKNPMLMATVKALELLENAYLAKRGLTIKGGRDAGSVEFIEGDHDFMASVDRARGWEWRYDENGNRLPVPFDEGLKELMPLTGYNKARARDERMARFRAYIKALLRHAHPEQDEQSLILEAGDRIGKMQQDGIPWDLFERALMEFHGWWQANLGDIRSASGAKGIAAKHAKATKPRRARKKK